MEQVFVTFLTAGPVGGIPAWIIQSKSFGLDDGIVFSSLLVCSVSSQIICSRGAALSFNFSSRLTIVLACTLQLLGWSLVASNWLRVGMLLIGCGAGLAKEAIEIDLVLREKEKTIGKQDLRLALTCLAVASGVASVVPHWMNQMRLSFSENPFSISWQYMCACSAFLPFIAGCIAFFRMKPKGRVAVRTFIYSADGIVGDFWVWTGTLVHALLNLRMLIYLVQIIDTARDMTSFHAKPHDAEEFAEIVWKTLSCGNLLCLPLGWLLIDKVTCIHFALLTSMLAFVWSSIVSTGSMKEAAFGLLLSIFLKPLMDLCLPVLMESRTRQCQFLTRGHSTMVSLSGFIQLSIVLCCYAWTIKGYTLTQILDLLKPILNSSILAVWMIQLCFLLNKN